jgi:RNA polymerase sigma-70 factor (ECF subfamily)
VNPSEFNEEYASRLRGDDPVTWEHFYSHFRPRIRAKLRAQLPWHMVDDMMGEVLVAVVENIKLGKLENPNRLAGYVLNTCQYKVLEAIRRLANERTSAGVDCDVFPMNARSPQQRLLADEESKEIQHVLGELKKRDQDILLAVFFYKMNRDEICQKYSVTREQLKIVLCRARQRFQKKWKRP